MPDGLDDEAPGQSESHPSDPLPNSPLTIQEWNELAASIDHLSGPDAWNEDRLEPALIPVTHYVPRLMAELQVLRATTTRPITFDTTDPIAPANRCPYRGPQGAWPGAPVCELDGRTHYHYCERPGSRVEVVFDGSARGQQIRVKERW